MLPTINVIRSQGPLSRPIASDDSKSALIFYSDKLPTGFDSSNRIKVCNSPNDAVNLGIVGDFSDETRAFATLTVASASAGTTVTVSVPFGPTTTLGAYTIGASDNVASASLGIAREINNSLKFTATASGSLVTVTAPASTIDFLYGSAINGTFLTASCSTTSSVVNATAFVSGSAPYTEPFKYHIDEYFRMNAGPLWVAFFPEFTGTTSFTEIETVQNFADGEIRQFGIYTGGQADFSTAQVVAIQARLTALSEQKRPAVAILGPELVGMNLNDLPNLQSLSATNVAVCIGQDGNATGSKLYSLFGKSIGTVGACLGVLSNFRVNESIGWVAKLDSIAFSSEELALPAFAEGTLYRSLAPATLNVLAGKNYMFLRKFEGRAATYISDSKTAVSNSSDFFSLERNRTIDKARRVVYLGLLPFVNSPVDVDSEGKLTDLARNIFSQAVASQLDTLVARDEIADYTVFINPDQIVTVTDTIEINLGIVPKGVARLIQVTVQFQSSAIVNV